MTRKPFPEELNKYLPHDYVKRIFALLEGKYSESLILKVKTGERYNTLIYETILDIALEGKINQQRIEEKVNNLTTENTNGT